MPTTRRRPTVAPRRCPRPLPARASLGTAGVLLLAAAAWACGDARGNGEAGGLADERAASPPIPTAEAEWRAMAAVPEARTEVSVAADERRIFLLGGFRREGDGRGRPATSAPRAVFAYDPATDRWSVHDSIPRGVNHAGLAHLDGRLYLVGGFRENTFEPVDDVWIHDPAEGGWRRGAPLPTPRGALAVAVLDGRIHAVGGNVPEGLELSAEEHRPSGTDTSVGTHEVYDPATDRWSRLAPLPTPRNHLGAAVLDGKIHVVAGRVARDFELTAHEIYDPSADAWSEGPPVPTGRSGVATVAHEGRLYLFGGETFGPPEARTFHEAERYDPRAGSWERLPPMPTARHGLGAAPFGDAIYVISGGPEPGFAFGTANERISERP